MSRPFFPIFVLLLVVCGCCWATAQDAAQPAAVAGRSQPHVKELPIPAGATDLTYMKRRGDIRCRVTTDVQPTGEFYAKQLAEQRWTKSGKDNVQRDFWVQKFGRGPLTLEVRVDRRAGGSEVRLTPAGLLWDEDLAPFAKDLPLPTTATVIEYDDFFESIKFHSPDNVKTVADFLSRQLAEKNGPPPMPTSSPTARRV